MIIALRHAQHAFRESEVPIGAIIVDELTNEVITSSRNKVEVQQDPTAHAEMNCIRDACAYKNNWRLSNCVLYTTLEPCPMCLAAAQASRLKKIVYGASDPRLGATGNGFCNLNDGSHPFHNLEIQGGILENESKQLLQRFFRQKRLKNDNEGIIFSRDYNDIDVTEQENKIE